MERKAVTSARCVRCGVECPASDVLFTERGFACIPCALGAKSPRQAPVYHWLGSLSRALARLFS